MMNLVILGSTGSIGRQTLEVVAAHRDRYTVCGLAAGHLDSTFAAQAAAWPAARLWTADERPASGGLVELATMDDADLIVVATTGMAALPAVLAALSAGKRVALANKETLVVGGHLVARLLADDPDPLDRLRPIDSEHSAIWQCLRGEQLADVRRLILTASGGPFRGRVWATLGDVQPAEALAHPTWQMGPKITIDSATLVNKAFEAIEASWLYGLASPRIEAVIHPTSVVHSFVEFVDGTFKAALGMPDMRLPIGYALSAPERAEATEPTLGPVDWGSLEFTTLEAGMYPAYDLARAAGAAGGNRGAVLNAADEVAVEAFLAGSLRFSEMPDLIARALDEFEDDEEPELDDIPVLDADVRSAAASWTGMTR
jgi:1-deoxy-D-xylulose-5-phosphate reductoisomerase